MDATPPELSPASLVDRACRRAAVEVREARPHDMAQIVRLFESTWGAGRSPDDGLLRAVAHAGNTVILATDAGGRTVGAALGFLGWEGGVHLHSHMAAVDPRHQGGGVGFALKVFQRQLCLDRGIRQMRWTFDPLIRRNAYFNLVKLGAEVVAFHPDFYGDLDDAISGGDASDRLEVLWRLDSPRVRHALAERPAPAWAGPLRLELATDYQALRRLDPDAAALLREESRQAFAEAAERGLRAELDRTAYVFTPTPPEA
ncbi:GNAT family N-acetyltransferase [Compostimonas suwonensis]|uniref:Putative GNAT superfamily acetyltransferase n=1 Tax=Compostimonas suwonensis TaxID=1048394 RepID=A0A2M9BCG8_9MICO|nr:GNAT family N-acetyltransferase [Compostimonas suwonensis]PJJ55645.1 putative GNAT superfamily acetyltransferase [Compostimonas suwonensis]